MYIPRPPSKEQIEYEKRCRIVETAKTILLASLSNEKMLKWADCMTIATEIEDSKNVRP